MLLIGVKAIRIDICVQKVITYITTVNYESTSLSSQTLFLIKTREPKIKSCKIVSRFIQGYTQEKVVIY